MENLSVMEELSVIKLSDKIVVLPKLKLCASKMVLVFSQCYVITQKLCF